MRSFLQYYEINLQSNQITTTDFITKKSLDAIENALLEDPYVKKFDLTDPNIPASERLDF